MKKYLYYLLIIPFALSCKVTKTKKVTLSTYVFEWRKQKTSIVFVNDSTFRLENIFKCQNLPDKGRYYNNTFFFKKVINNKKKPYLTLLITKKLNPDTTKAPVILPYKVKGNCFNDSILSERIYLYDFLLSHLNVHSTDSIVGVPVIKSGDVLFFNKNKKYLFYLSHDSKHQIVMSFKKN